MARFNGQPAARLSLWLVLGVPLAGLCGLQAGFASQRPPGPADPGPLWISESRLDDGRRLLVVVDQAGRRAAVYHLDGTAGTLTLRSTRDLSWDLMVEDFNAQEPRPAALRKMLQLPPPEAPR